MLNRPSLYQDVRGFSRWPSGTRDGLIAALREMRGYLDKEDGDLRELTDSAIGKLEAMTDADYAALDLTADFDAEDDGGE